jgi:hypothetical protein
VDVVLLVLDYDKKGTFEHLNYWMPRPVSESNVDNCCSTHCAYTFCSYDHLLDESYVSGGREPSLTDNV